MDQHKGVHLALGNEISGNYCFAKSSWGGKHACVMSQEAISRQLLVQLEGLIIPNLRANSNRRLKFGRVL